MLPRRSLCGNSNFQLIERVCGDAARLSLLLVCHRRNEQLRKNLGRGGGGVKCLASEPASSDTYSFDLGDRIYRSRYTRVAAFYCCRIRYKGTCSKAYHEALAKQRLQCILKVPGRLVQRVLHAAVSVLNSVVEFVLLTAPRVFFLQRKFVCRCEPKTIQCASMNRCDNDDAVGGVYWWA